MASSIFTGFLKALGLRSCYELDRLIVNTATESLTEEQANVLEYQANYGSRCSHLFANQYVSFSNHNSQLHGESVLLRYAGSIRPFAAVRVSISRKSTVDCMRAELTIGAGAIREILYDKKPYDVFGSMKPSWRQLDVVAETKLLFSPDEPEPFPCNQVCDDAILPDWLKQWTADYRLTQSLSPLSTEARTRLEDFHELPFPEDYLDTVAHLEQVVLSGGVEILGLSRIWSYVTPTEYVVKLCNVRDRGCLCLLRGGSDKLYYIDNEEHVPVSVGYSFREAVEHALAHGVQDWVK